MNGQYRLDGSMVPVGTPERRRVETLAVQGDLLQAGIDRLVLEALRAGRVLTRIEAEAILGGAPARADGR